MLKFDILTLFPEMIEGFISSSILKRACEQNLIEINVINFRKYSGNKHSTVDDYAYGGGAGMLIRVDPIVRALKDIEGYNEHKTWNIITSPTGKTWNQQEAIKASKEHDHIVIVCGHYEGIDERAIELCVDRQISIGDYVLTGGEIPAMANRW